MYIEINVHEGDEPLTPIYEKAEASNFADAVGEIERIARHWMKDKLDGKFDDGDRQNNDNEASQEKAVEDND